MQMLFIENYVANALSQDMVKSMADNPIIFAMANPNPEINPLMMPKRPYAFVRTGR